MSTHDEITIEILEDGTVKTTTGRVSAANHQNAEEYLKYIARLTGGEVQRSRTRQTSHAHTHHGEHRHGH